MDKYYDNYNLKNKYICPCCKYPTLDERGGYDICHMCNWEDDGQDDPIADKVLGGPNSDYSLTEAQQNFKLYYEMYSPEKQEYRKSICKIQSEEKISIKKKMIILYEQITKTTDKKDLKILWKKITKGEKDLYKLLKKDIKEYEKLIKEKKSFFDFIK